MLSTFQMKKTSIARSAYRRASSSFIQVKGVHNSLTEVRRDVHLSLNAKGVFTLLLLSSLADVALHSDVFVLTSMGALHRCLAIKSS